MPSSHHVSSCTGRRPATRSARTAAAVLAAGASLALVAGCASSSTGGTGTADARAAAPAAATSAAATPTLVGLATRVATAVSSATSVHVESDLSGLSVLPVAVGTVEGDVALAGGKPTAADGSAGGFGLRYANGSAWVQLPTSSTRWWLVSPDSSNPMIAAAASKLAAARATLIGLDPTALLGAASGLREIGPAEVGGVAATQYAFTLDPEAVASALGVTLPAGGASPVPVKLWLDASDRPVQVTASPTVRGTATPLTVTLSAWDAPVTITAPPAAQVAS
ncbi:hypothetical protein ACXR2U_08675 [Jatrophihabitans sp. YIM 134969]